MYNICNIDLFFFDRNIYIFMYLLSYVKCIRICYIYIFLKRVVVESREKMRRFLLFMGNMVFLVK